MVCNFSFLKEINGDKNLIHFHGFTDCKENNKALRDICEKSKINYFGLDFPGQGDCTIGFDDKPTMEFLVEYAINFIESQDLKNVIISGHSMGGAIAMMVASKLGEDRVLGLILEDPVNPGISEKNRNSLFEKVSNIKTINKNVNNNIELMKMNEAQIVWFSKLAKSMCSEAFFDKLSFAFKNYKAKIDVIFGELDKVVDTTESKTYLTGFRKVKFNEIKFSLHVPHRENPFEYSQIIKKCFEKY